MAYIVLDNEERGALEGMISNIYREYDPKDRKRNMIEIAFFVLLDRIRDAVKTSHDVVRIIDQDIENHNDDRPDGYNPAQVLEFANWDAVGNFYELNVNDLGTLEKGYAVRVDRDGEYHLLTRLPNPYRD